MARGREVIAVVGGGASGALAALHLTGASTRTRVLVIEPDGVLGRGVAYPDTDRGHLLNTRAGAMSAFGDDPGHFARWCRATQPRAVDELAFVPRSWFGTYLSSLTGSVDHVRATAVDLVPHRGRTLIRLSTGGRITADRVVLAPGASPPAWPAPLGDGGARWVTDPWAPGALDGLPTDRPVLLLGTGLTAVDVALELRRAGHGRIVATSRHGLLPLAHPEAPFAAVTLPPAPTPTARSLLGWAHATASEIGDWRPVVDALRGQTDQLWGSLSPADRRRLLRLVRRRFEVARHRMAPAVHARVEALVDQGHLVVRPGAITGYDVVQGGYDVAVAGRRERVGAVVNCTGPPLDVRTSRHPLIRLLLARGVVRPGPLNLGLRAGADGSLPGTGGALWLVGALRRGDRWETTAIPEIRAQAEDLAHALGHRQPVLSA